MYIAWGILDRRLLSDISSSPIISICIAICPETLLSLLIVPPLYPISNCQPKLLIFIGGSFTLPRVQTFPNTGCSLAEIYRGKVAQGLWPNIWIEKKLFLSCLPIIFIPIANYLKGVFRPHFTQPFPLSQHYVQPSRKIALGLWPNIQSEIIPFSSQLGEFARMIMLICS